MSEVETTPLFARIEELAARAANEVEAELSLASEVYAVRSELSALAGRLDGDVRSPLEARLAALEDSLDGVAERLEAFARDGASTTAERLAMLTKDVEKVSRAVAARDTELRALIAEQMNGLRTAGSERDAGLRNYIAERVAESATPIQDVQSAVVPPVEAAVSGLTGSVREAIDAFAGSVEASLTALGGSVGSALAEARDAHHDHLDEVSGYLDTAMETVTAGQAQVTAKLGAQGTALDEMRLGVAVTNTAIDGLASKVAAIAKTATDNTMAVNKLGAGLAEVAKQVVKEAHAAAAAEVSTFRERMELEISGLREQMRVTAATVIDSRQELDEGTQRLESTGHALLAYLGQRDLVLEEERDRLLRDVLDEFAKGLDAKSRKHLSARVGEALERSRDARDADRYRKSRSETEAPPVPLVVSAPASRPRPAREAPAATGLMRPPAPPAAPAAAPAPAKAAKPAKPAAKASGTPARPTKAAAAKPAKATAPPAKATTKTATKVAKAPAKSAAKPAAKGRATATRSTAPAAAPDEPAPGATEPLAPIASAPPPPPRRARASVDAMPAVASPSSAIDAATGDDAGGFDDPTGVSGAAAVDAFTAAASARRRPFGGRRSRP